MDQHVRTKVCPTLAIAVLGLALLLQRYDSDRPVGGVGSGSGSRGTSPVQGRASIFLPG